MLAYKFRSSSQIAFALDIIFYQRLYCADWSRLNDPMEGKFSILDSSGKSNAQEKVERIIREKKEIKICSLSRSIRSHLLWAHYASGFDGLAIEVELPDDASDVKPISYGSILSSILKDKDVRNPEKEAQEILCKKYKEWKYEQEVRVLYKGDYYKLLSPVKAVIAGHRMQPALYKMLEHVCKAENIELRKTIITDRGIASVAG